MFCGIVAAVAAATATVGAASCSMTGHWQLQLQLYGSFTQQANEQAPRGRPTRARHLCACNNVKIKEKKRTVGYVPTAVDLRVQFATHTHTCAHISSVCVRVFACAHIFLINFFRPFFFWLRRTTQCRKIVRLKVLHSFAYFSRGISKAAKIYINYACTVKSWDSHKKHTHTHCNLKMSLKKT